MTTVQAAGHQPPGIWQLAWPAIMLNLLHSLVSMVSITQKITLLSRFCKMVHFSPVEFLIENILNY